VNWFSYPEGKLEKRKIKHLHGRGDGTPRSLKSGSANIYRGE